MSTTTFGTADALTQKIWGRIAFVDSVKSTLFGKLMGKKASSIIQIKDELTKTAGDRIRFRLRSLPQGQGVEGAETLEGNEEGLDYQYKDLQIDQKRHASKTDLGMTQQRTNWDVREDLKDQEAEWWEEYFDLTMIEYLTGDTTGGLTKHGGRTSFGGNSLLAPTTDRIIYGGNATAKADVDATDTFDLQLIDKAIEKAKTASPTFKKASFDGKKCYVLILHPWQVTSMRTNTSTGQWFDIQKAAMTGGKIADNPIWSEALGMYSDTLIIENTRIKSFTDYGAGSNVSAARALFMGAQAGMCGFGRKTAGPSKMQWTEKTFDYGDKAGVGTCIIWGIQKIQFAVDSASAVSDYCTIAIDTAAAAAS